MMRQLSVLTLVVITLVRPCSAQEWLSRLPQKPVEELTFNDFKTAFETYYRERPVAAAAASERVTPAFTFTDEEAGPKKDLEAYKQFKRWEWFTEPRVYPTGRWDNQKVIAAFEAVPETDASLFNKLDMAPHEIAQGQVWSPLGPSDAIGGTNLGRVNAIAITPGTPNTIYIGAPGGGVWKTSNGGATWSTTTGSLPTLSVGDIAIDPTNHNNIYVATGDAFGYGNPFWGGTYAIGVWKSTNAGGTWSATGLSFTLGQNRTIRRLVIHPTNPHILLAATSAGLYHTTDAGVSWASLWPDSTFDVEFDPSNGNIVYATTTRVMKSTNAGATWAPLAATSCGGQRFNIEVARSNPHVLYTLCTNGQVEKSTDGGATWSTTNPSGVFLYGYYDNVLAVSPVDPDVVIVAGMDMKKTTNGGNSWSSVPTAGHVDNHCVTFAPGSSTSILCGNDGGLFHTTNGGANWSSLNKGLAITQFYRVGLSRITPGLMIAGAQDNGNMKLGAGTWTNVTNADGMGGFIDFSNDNNMYATIQYGGFYRSTNGGSSWTSISITTPPNGAWVTPFCQSQTVANTIYAATDKVYKSTNQGTTWAAISGTLSGVGQFTILKTHPIPDYLIAGDAHYLYRTTNGGTSWTDITGTLPVAGNFLTDATMSDNDPNVIWATFSGYNAGQKVYKTTNGGTTWTNISGTLPNLPANCVTHEDKAGNPIYVGTDAGVYYIKDGMPGFVPFKLGLPNVIIDDLVIHYGSKKIRAATYGRGLWECALKP
jgi:photosystem II stability/assembly factor-like uncharacterized protein